jgi:hypothetical protein
MRGEFVYETFVSGKGVETLLYGWHGEHYDG